jgi:hypothetical protein
MFNGWENTACNAGCRNIVGCANSVMLLSAFASSGADVFSCKQLLLLCCILCWQASCKLPAATPYAMTPLILPTRTLHLRSLYACSFDPGAYLISLDVSGPGGTSTAQALLNVLGNTPPVASAGGPYTTQVGTAVVVSAEQSTDADGDPLTYSWVLYRGDLPIGNYSGPALNMKLNKAGMYTLKLTVSDDRGGASTTSVQLTSYEASALPAPAPMVFTPQSAPPAAATTTVIAAVPAPPPSSAISSSGLRLPSTTPPTPTYTQSVYQPSVYTPPAATTRTGLAGTPSSATTPAPAMCLFTKDGNSTNAAPGGALNILNIFSLTNTYWAPCQQSTAAPVSGSSSAPAAAGAAKDPLKSTAVIRSPEAFVTATGSATQVSSVTAQRIRCECSCALTCVCWRCGLCVVVEKHAV